MTKASHVESIPHTCHVNHADHIKLELQKHRDTSDVESNPVGMRARPVPKIFGTSSTKIGTSSTKNWY
jgi:hypothetical protein